MNTKELTLNEYQLKAMDTCMASCNNLSYMLLNLVGEVGEFASKIAKSIRKSEITIGGEAAIGVIENHPGVNDDTAYHYMCEELKKEAGDILWQLSGVCSVMGWRLEDIAQMNIDKLASRKQRNELMEMETIDNPLQTQVGGSHYKDLKIQPIEYIHANGLDFLSGNIVKYASRHRNKNGAEDVKKIIHYAQLILKLDYGEE